MKILFSSLANLILVLLFISQINIIYSQDVYTYNPPFDDEREWGVEPGISGYISKANYTSGSVSAFTSAWAGAAAAEASVKINLPVFSEPIGIKVVATVKYINASERVGYGAVAGPRLVYGVNNNIHYKDVEYGLSWENIYESAVQLAELATGYTGISAALSLPAKLTKIVGYANDIFDAVQLKQKLDAISGTTETISFTFQYDPDVVNVIRIGLRSECSGALTGSAFSLIFGQVTQVKIYTDALRGDWISVPEVAGQWIIQDRAEDGNSTDEWWDKAIKDNTGLGHSAIYYPYSADPVSPCGANYLKRNGGNEAVPPNDFIWFNNPYSGCDPVFTDEYFELSYSSGLTVLDNEGTFEAWVYPMGDTPYRSHIIYTSEGSGDGFGGEDEIHLSINPDGRFSFYIGDGTNTISLASTGIGYGMNLRYYHVLGTYKNRDDTLMAALYVDGVKADSAFFTGAGVTANISLSEILLGNSSQKVWPFKGKMKGVKIHGRMMSDDEALFAYYSSGGDTDLPDTPVLTAEPEFSPGTSNLVSWSECSDATSGVDYYLLVVDDNSTFSTPDSFQTKATSMLITDLISGTKYYYKVKSIDGGANGSSWSNVEYSTQDVTSPSSVSIYAEPSTTRGTSNQIAWTKSEDFYSNVSYWIQCSPDKVFETDSTECFLENGWIEGGGDAVIYEDYTFTGLEIGTKYYYRVKARDEAGNESNWSDIDSSIQISSSANTYFVSPTGTDATGDGSLANPWRTIQFAENNASSFDVIKVMDDDNDATDDYTEYIEIRTSDLTIESYDNNSTKPTLKTPYTHMPVFQIFVKNVTIRGLRIYGATSSGTAAIKVFTQNGIVIENNIIGYDASHTNYNGIDFGSNTNYSQQVEGNTFYNTNYDFSAGNTKFTEFYNNTFTKDAIFGAANSCSAINNNGTGKIIFDSGRKNNISGNDGMRFSSNSFGSINILSGNNFTETVFLYKTSNVIKDHIFLNNITPTPSDVQHSYCSPVKIGYNYEGSASCFKEFLGNYCTGSFGASGSDADNNGIFDSHHEYSDVIYEYPLTEDISNYDLQLWTLSSRNLCQANFINRYNLIEINSGQTKIWAEENAAENTVTINGGTEVDMTTWSGLISLDDFLNENDSMKIELGYCDDDAGNNFVSGKVEGTITYPSLGLETNSLYTFYTNSNTFNLPAGKHFAIRITNLTPYVHKIFTGGSWSFISASIASDPLPVELISFTADVIEGNSVLLNWETATEINNYGFEVQKSVDSSQNSEWEIIGFVQGHGTTNSPKNYEFTDYELPNSVVVSYRLKQIDNDGKFTYSKIVTIDLSTITGVEVEIPVEYSLSQNYPNPFNPVTIIKFGMPENGFVDLRVYNILGQEVAKLVNKEMRAGYHLIEFTNNKLASGIYIYRLTIESKKNCFSSVKKMVYLK